MFPHSRLAVPLVQAHSSSNGMSLIEFICIYVKMRELMLKSLSIWYLVSLIAAETGH